MPISTTGRAGDLGVGVVEGGSNQLVQPLPALSRTPRTGRAAPRAAHPAQPAREIEGRCAGRRGAWPGLQRVSQRRLGEQGGFLRREQRGRHLFLPGPVRRSGQDDELGLGGSCGEHPAPWSSHPRVPPRVPVTLDGRTGAGSGCPASVDPPISDSRGHHHLRAGSPEERRSVDQARGAGAQQARRVGPRSRRRRRCGGGLSSRTLFATRACTGQLPPPQVQVSRGPGARSADQTRTGPATCGR